MVKGKSAVAEKPAKTNKKSRAVEEDDEEEEETPKAKKASTATKSKKPARASDDDDEEDEDEAPAKKKAVAKNGKAKKAKAGDGDYTPNKNSMRDFIMRALKKGGTSQQIKKRAAALAEKAGVEELSEPKAYKNFDVAYFAKFLKDKGYDVEIDEESDTYAISS